MIDCTLVMFPLSCLYIDSFCRGSVLSSAAMPIHGRRWSDDVIHSRRCGVLGIVGKTHTVIRIRIRRSVIRIRVDETAIRIRIVVRTTDTATSRTSAFVLFPRLRLRFDASVSAYSDDWIIYFYCLLYYLIFTICCTWAAFLLWWSGRLDSRPLHSIAFSYHHILPSYFQSVCQSQHRCSIFRRRQDAHRETYSNTTKR